MAHGRSREHIGFTGIASSSRGLRVDRHLQADKTAQPIFI